MLSKLRADPKKDLPSRYQHSTPAELKNRTEKARTQNLLNRLGRKLASENPPQVPQEESFAAQLQKFFFTQSFFKAQFEEGVYSSSGTSDFQTFQRDRARSVFSLARALAQTLIGMFKLDIPGSRIFHVVNCHIADDTSTRMRGPLFSDRSTVFTIMNTVQSVHIRHIPSTLLAQGASEHDLHTIDSCLSLRVPTPLQVLLSGNAPAIHKSFAESAILTSIGVGDMLHSFGIARDILKQVPFKTFVFVGDALKANESAFQAECRRILENRKTLGNHVAIRFRCAIHQVCLVRKPVVLWIPRLWSTVVRLSHLYETLSFRRLFARALGRILATSFAHFQVPRLPDTTGQWKKTRESLMLSFQSSSKLRKRAFMNCLEFFNGDLSSQCVMHYCTPGEDGEYCCTNYTDALQKCMKLIVPFLAKGFPVPLLYRFKHYDEAISFIVFGTTLHALLTRTLATMSLGNSGGPEQEAKMVDRLLADVDLVNANPDGSPEAACRNLFAEESEDFAAYNAKRKQLVQQEIVRPEFLANSHIICFMIQPMDQQINMLFARSRQLTKLSVLGTSDDSWSDSASKSKELFLSIVLGEFGWDIIRNYIERTMHDLGSLEATGVSLKSENLQTIFTMMILIISDTWKRFVHDYSAFPYKLFQLVPANFEQFVRLWDMFQEKLHSCKTCMDDSFTKQLLTSFPRKLAKEPEHVQSSVYRQVQLLLGDISVHGPVTSDAVEVKNGQVQQIASQRGNTKIKTPNASKESSFLQAAIRDYELAKLWVEDETLPSKRTVSGILRMQHASGGSNQFSTETCAGRSVVTFIGFSYISFIFPVV